MALLFSDGFDQSYRASSFSGCTWNAAYGRWGGGGVRCSTNSSSAYNAKFNYDTYNIVHAAFNMKITAPWNTTTGSYVFCGFKNPAQSNSGGICIRYGALACYYFSSSTSIVGFASKPAPYILDEWAHIEIAIKFDTASNGGFCKLWWDEELIMDVTGTMAAAATPLGHIFICNPSSSGYIYFDDVLCWNETGSAFNPPQLGRHRISTILPTGDSTPTQWTPLSGSDNYAMIDDSGFHDGDTTYNSNIYLNLYDVYSHDGLPGGLDPAAISAVCVINTTRHTGAGGAVCPVLGVSGNWSSFSYYYPSSSYTANCQAAAVNPNGSGAWSTAAVNSCVFGIERTDDTV